MLVTSRIRSTVFFAAIVAFSFYTLADRSAAQTSDPDIRGLIRDFDQIAGDEKRIVIRGEMDALDADVEKTSAFCTGEFEEPEYSRRAATCADELPKLDARREILIDRSTAIKLRDAERSMRGAATKQAFDQLQRRVTELETVISRNSRFAGILERCKRKDGLSVWTQCLRQAILDAGCVNAEQRSAASRREIRTGQQELASWSKLNADAQDDALIAGAKFVAGEYAVGGAAAVSKVTKLAREVERVSRKTKNARDAKVRLMYARKLHAEIDRMRVPLTELLARGKTGKILDIEERRGVVRDTLHAEFKVASARDDELRRILESSPFKKSFSGEGINTPGLDLLATLAEDAGKEIGIRVLTLKKFESMTGPHVRAVVFVRDATYNALLSILSTQRVLQQNDLVGDLARASGVLQEKYQIDVDALRECRVLLKH